MYRNRKCVAPVMWQVLPLREVLQMRLQSGTVTFHVHGGGGETSTRHRPHR